MQASHAVTVLLDDDLLTFNRVIGVVRRRNLPVAGLRIGPGEPTGLRFSFFVQADDGNAERLLRQLEKVHGVRHVAVLPVSHPSEAVL
jgi:acetolactate synthase regulatory subunit